MVVLPTGVDRRRHTAAAAAAKRLGVQQERKSGERESFDARESRSTRLVCAYMIGAVGVSASERQKKGERERGRSLTQAVDDRYVIVLPVRSTGNGSSRRRRSKKLRPKTGAD